MLLNFGNKFNIRCLVIGLMALLNTAVAERLFVGDDCEMKDKTPGICLPGSKCTAVLEAIECGQMSPEDPVHCGFALAEEAICCPKDDNNSFKGCNTRRVNRISTTPSQRPAVTVCRRIEEKLSTALVPNILDGTATVLGEFPHMVAIGFVDDNRSENYNFRCGGTLIDKQWVLTAAHCFVSRDQAKVVRLGIVNFTDPEQIASAVTIGIKKIHIHPDYSSIKRYNDVALLHLEREVDTSVEIAPTCLYTEDADPPSNFDIYVTGWGVTELKRRSVSKTLLKAKLEITSLQKCNASYIENGQTDGLIESQLCAFDPGKTKDTCQGDSGGPLNMVLDLDQRKYRVVGVTSTGFGCGSDTPGLYTRVSSFLDYIESIAWPDLKT